MHLHAIFAHKIGMRCRNAKPCRHTTGKSRLASAAAISREPAATRSTMIRLRARECPFHPLPNDFSIRLID